MLTPTLRSDFSRRDAKAIESAFSLVATNWQASRWLDSKSRYAKNCIAALTKDFDSTGKIRHKHLREYIAASLLVHCMDGWAFLGKALAAQLVGDHDTARHLGYYAELRAAMALLSAHGVGVFDREHAVVMANGRCIRVAHRRNRRSNRPSGPGTHAFVWDALEEWAKSPDARDTILECVKVGGQSLNVWLSHFAPSQSLASMLAERWLLSWGLDISRLAKDRDARNLSSYRPTTFSTGRPAPVSVSLDVISTLWSSCEPTPDSRFSELDRQLLRATLRQAFQAAVGSSPSRARKQFRLRVQAALHFLNPIPVSGVDFEEFLTATNTQATSILEVAARDDKPISPGHSLQVVCRSLLLLRIATGASARFVSKLPSSNLENLSFWIEEVGQDRALWRPGDTPSSLRDLWKDPEDALKCVAADVSHISSYSDLWRRQALAASILSSCERVGLWGIAA